MGIGEREGWRDKSERQRERERGGETPLDEPTLRLISKNFSNLDGKNNRP